MRQSFSFSFAVSFLAAQPPFSQKAPLRREPYAKPQNDFPMPVRSAIAMLNAWANVVRPPDQQMSRATLGPVLIRSSSQPGVQNKEDVPTISWGRQPMMSLKEVTDLRLVVVTRLGHR